MDLSNRSVAHVLDLLITAGYNPETVIDVGVATGTPEIYTRFPDAYYYLVEPLSHWKPNIETHLKRLKGEFHHCAAGDADGEARIVVPKGARPGGANLIHAYKDEHIEIAEDVSVRRLDGLLDSEKFGNHCLLKTDCQGFDARALLGAEGLLDRVSVIIMESSMIVPEGIPTIADVMPMLKAKGFMTFDIADVSLTKDGFIMQVNYFFVHRRRFNPYSIKKNISK